MRLPDERFCDLGEVRICFETFGQPSDPAVLLIMGLGTQMLGWHEDFCDQLASEGRFVIRYDNRDCGHSTRFDHVPAPSTARLLARKVQPLAYSLDQMADDAAGLLDHLEIESADVAGASMGAMIAQTLAVNRPGKVRSLISIMARTGSRKNGQPSPRVLPYLVRRLPSEREAYIQRLLKAFRLIGSPGFERDEAELRKMLELSHERGVSPEGMARQLAAITAAGNREASMRRITAPTVVIHGTEDGLIGPSGGRATAAAIPGARLILIEGMGHDLPREVWPQIAAPILAGTPAPIA